MLEQITPVILTYNEAPNIGRTLGELRWACDVVVVDSFSTDETLEIVAASRQARVFQRGFDNHENQWNYALTETGIASEWVLALDADFILTPRLVEELSRLRPQADVNGYSASFVYCVDGHPLRGSAYPPVTVLYRRSKALYMQDGHTQRVFVEGKLGHLRAPIIHDDRKPLGHWLQSQARYMRIEAGKIAGMDYAALGWADRMRKMRCIAPFAMLFYCLVVKRAMLDGRAGIFYALQRMVAELILSLYLVEGDLRKVRHSKKEAKAERALPTAE